jgi:hypothetical protein
LNERIRIDPPTGELLPAEERLQNVLKAIEDRMRKERAELDKEWEAMFDAVFVDTSGFEKRKAFLSGLDIAWSLAQTEALRRQSVDGVPDLLPPAP